MSPNTLTKYASTILVFLSIVISAVADEELLVRPLYSDLKFSPDGNFLAGKMRTEEGHFLLIVRNLENPSSSIISIKNKDEQWSAQKTVKSYEWVSSDKIIVVSSWLGQEDALHVVKAGKSDSRYLRSDAKFSIIDPLEGDSHFIVTKTPLDQKVEESHIVRYNSDDIKDEEILLTVPSNTLKAFTDLDGTPRLILRDEKQENGSNKKSWYGLAEENTEWEKLELDPWVTVYGFTPDTDRVWLGGWLGGDGPSIYEYSFSEKRSINTFATHSEFEITKYGIPLYSRAFKGLVGIHLDLAVRSTEWLLPSLSKYQSQLDNLFKDTNNRIVAWSSDLKRLAVERTFKDRPIETVYVDFSVGKVELLFANGGKVKTDTTPDRIHLKIPNRDGLNLDAFFTPAANNKKKAPLVVIVRNDPWGTIDRNGWDGEDQYFSSQGLAVLRVNFRTSGGMLGNYKANWHKESEALKPLNDIEDAVKWLIEKNAVDADRIGIMGTGVGGWVALATEIVSDLEFKAVVSYCGMYDLVDYRSEDRDKKLRDFTAIPFADSEKKHSEEALKRLSPIHQVDKIHGKVLIAYYINAPVDYLSQVRSFIKAAKSAGVKVEKPLTGNWWGMQITKDQDYVQFQRRFAQFFKKTL